MISPGDIVEGLDPTELVEVTRVAGFGEKMLIEGVTVTSRRLLRRPLSAPELAGLRKLRSKDLTFDGNAESFLLGAEAERIRIAHQFDPLFAVSSSIVDPLPHQVEAVYRYLLPLPRIRFMLADDTGAGKTIMTGLLIKELLFREVIEKVLIITPGGLTRQWAEDELAEKFGLPARLVNRASFDAEPSQFGRTDGGIFVTSIDFIARNEACLKAAEQTSWDMIVVDECHKLSAYEYGSKLDESERYRALKILSPRTDHLLFLTATPHRGRKDTFRRLLMLLDADLFTKDEHVTSRVQEDIGATALEEAEGTAPIKQARNRFFLRRLKEEMVDWSGESLFKPRHTKTVGYSLTEPEKVLYDDVTNYVRSKRKEAKAKKNRNVELTLMVMQRRLASSLYAITRTLENRLKALNEVLAILRDPNRSDAEKKRLLKGSSNDDVPVDISDYEDLSEEQRDAADRRIFRQVLTDDPAQVEKERDKVQDLFGAAKALENHKEAKFDQLLRVLDSSDVIRSDDEKLVIFTEHRDTLDNLTKRLTEKGYRVATIHGGMDPLARRQAQREFKLKAKIMIATDAAGEGINLQFCRYLINWDIPWNPNRLEQRMGRIHRYGQKDDVWVYNLVAQNTREGAVLQHVLGKLDTMREQMGDDRVYDVIDEWLEDVPLVQLIERAIDTPDEQTALEIATTATRDAHDQRAKRLVELQKRSSLASRLNLRAARDLRDQSDERRLQPLFVERFFERAWIAAGGTIRRDDQYPVWHLGPVPSALIERARQRRKGLPEKYETPFVFDKSLVSVASRIRIPENTKLIGPGHPLFEALLDWAIAEAQTDFARGVTLVDPNTGAPQRAWLVRSVVEDGRSELRKRKAREDLSLVLHDGAQFSARSPSALLNCVNPAPDGNDSPIIFVDTPTVPAPSPDEVQVWAYANITEPQLSKARDLRADECELRRSYLTTAFTELINELVGELNDLQHAQLLGDDNHEECQRLSDRIALLKTRRTERLRELELMMNLSANLPDVIAHARVLPVPQPVAPDPDAPKRGFGMRRDDEVERIAMEHAMAYERTRGWTPYDVSQDGEHYDVRSEGPNGEKRYIEVKGRASTGAIILTGPELDKLRQLGDRAWLYVVTQCKNPPPVLRTIQDPIPQLNPEALFRQVQFLVPEADWKAAAKAATVAT